MVATWLALLLLCSGDVHPNPGPLSTSSASSISTSSSSLSNTLLDALKLNHHLSFVHYNVQSIAYKLDILQTELFDFDVLAFTENWLHPGITTDDLLIESFNNPERKDRVDDRHGGVILYLKEAIHYYRRQDLEPRGTECIWIELVNKHKHVLFGVFYRPPNANSNYYSLIEDSLHLAVDTGNNDIVVTGDFNLNLLSSHTSRKIGSLCSQFAFYQSIDQPTYLNRKFSFFVRYHSSSQ